MKTLITITLLLLSVTLQAKRIKVNQVQFPTQDVTQEIQIFPNEHEKKMLNIQRITKGIALTSGTLSVATFQYDKPASIGFAISFLTSILIHDKIDNKLNKRLETYSLGSEVGVRFRF